MLPTRPTRTWNNQTWYLKEHKLEAARPGESNHGLGLTVDVAGLGVEPVNDISKWVLGNYSRFGFSHEHHDKSDPPHIRYFPGAAIPAEVDTPVVKPWRMFDPAKGMFSLWPLNPAKDALSMGAEVDAVRYAQGVFRCKMGYATAVNGTFDQRMTDFVNWFKTTHQLEANGIIGTRAWQLIDTFAVA